MWLSWTNILAINHLLRAIGWRHPLRIVLTNVLVFDRPGFGVRKLAAGELPQDPFPVLSSSMTTTKSKQMRSGPFSPRYGPNFGNFFPVTWPCANASTPSGSYSPSPCRLPSTFREMRIPARPPAKTTEGRSETALHQKPALYSFHASGTRFSIWIEIYSHATLASGGVIYSQFRLARAAGDLCRRCYDNSQVDEAIAMASGFVWLE